MDKGLMSECVTHWSFFRFDLFGLWCLRFGAWPKGLPEAGYTSPMAATGIRIQTHQRIALLVLLAITLAVRVGVLVALQNNLHKDPDAYRNIADNLLQFGIYGMGTGDPDNLQPTAYRPPLYPVLLAKFASDGAQVVLWRVALLHVVLGLATVWLVWVVAGQMEVPSPKSQVQSQGTGDGGQGTTSLAFRFVAGLLVASDPLLLNQSTLVMTETLAAFLTVLCLFALNRFTVDRRPWNAGLAGCAIGLAILCRPTYLPWLPLVGLTMLLLRHRNPTRQRGTDHSRPSLMLRVDDWLRRAASVAALGIIAAVVVSPWAIRNDRVFGKPIVSTTHGGYTLHLANNPDFYAHLASDRAHEPWDATKFNSEWRAFKYEMDALYARGRDFTPPEIRIDALGYEFAMEAAEQNTRQFLYACLYRLRQFWSPLPHRLTASESPARAVMRYAVAAWYVAVYLLAAIGIWKLRGKLLTPPWLWGVLLCLVYTGIHTFYWTNLRMRAPIMPIVALVAACGFAYLWQRLKDHRAAV